MTQADKPPTFEPTLGFVFNRISAMRQSKTYRPDLPLWAAFNKTELEAMFGKPEEAEQ